MLHVDSGRRYRRTADPKRCLLCVRHELLYPKVLSSKSQWFSGKIRACHAFTCILHEPRVRFTAATIFCCSGRVKRRASWQLFARTNRDGLVYQTLIHTYLTAFRIFLQITILTSRLCTTHTYRPLSSSIDSNRVTQSTQSTHNNGAKCSACNDHGRDRSRALY